MSSHESTDERPVDDTAAFRAFYLAEPTPDDEPRGPFYRLFIGWWLDRSRD
jgi:hypothetical protein